MSCICCFPWRPYTFVGKAPLPSFQLSYNVCLVLKRLRRAFILSKHRTLVFVKAQIMEEHSNIIWHGMVEVHCCLLKHARDLWPHRVQEIRKMPKGASNSRYVTEWKVCYSFCSVLNEEFRPFQYSIPVFHSSGTVHWFITPYACHFLGPTLCVHSKLSRALLEREICYLIVASLSEPHTDMLNVILVCLYVCVHRTVNTHFHK